MSTGCNIEIKIARMDRYVNMMKNVKWKQGRI